MMKASLMRLCPVFTSNRMVREYTERFYLRSHRRQALLWTDEAQRARELARWKQRIREHWSEVSVLDVQADTRDLEVGDSLKITAIVNLGELDSSEVAVVVHRGPLDQHGEIVGGKTLPMTPCDRTADGAIVCTSDEPLHHSGRQGFTVRVLPRHEDLEDTIDLPLVIWG
jgi:starch phosphorylase